MQPEEITLVTKNKKLTIDGAFFYEITLSDGSEWLCDYNGENWKRTNLGKRGELSDEELRNKFNTNKKKLT